MEDISNGICSVDERLKFYDCDYKGRMKISTMLKVSAELAGYDYTIKGYGHEVLWEKEMVFLLSRISMKIFSYPIQQENLTNTTWECGKKGAMFLRGTEIMSENGNIAASILNGWILTNPITRHIYKPNFFNFDMPQVMDKPVFALPLGKISYDSLEKTGEREVRISDLDGNGHVYNATYADIACDFLEKETYKRNLDNFRINYVSEAVLGDIIEIFTETTENRTVIIGKVHDKPCFETEFIWVK